jgi:hypothetical protein
MNVLQVLVVYALLGTAANSPEVNDVSSEMLRPARWEIAPEFFWHRYREPGVMKNSGILYGAAASYTRYYQPSYQKRLFRMEGEFATGEVDYDGSLMDGTPYSLEGIRDYLVNVRIVWGELWRTKAWENQLYFGLGYRYLNDDSSFDSHGYERQSNYLYLPLGVKTYNELGDNWYLGLGGELDVLLIGLQISGIAESETDSSDVENWQWPGFGVRGSVELRHRTKSLDLAVAPFIQYWWIDNSQESASGVWCEPRNNTLEYGLSLIWRF